MPHHHIKPAQFELFALSDKANAVTTPEWQDLPAWTAGRMHQAIAGIRADCAESVDAASQQPALSAVT